MVVIIIVLMISFQHKGIGGMAEAIYLGLNLMISAAHCKD